MKPILNSLKSRLAWYEKALAMITGDSPWENGFGWPIIPGIPLPIGSARKLYLDQYIMFLAGCIHELRNTIDMLNAKGVSSHVQLRSSPESLSFRPSHQRHE